MEFTWIRIPPFRKKNGSGSERQDKHRIWLRPSGKNRIRIPADVTKLLTQMKSAVLPGISKVAKMEIPCGLFTLINMRKIGIFCCYKIIIEEGS